MSMNVGRDDLCILCGGGLSNDFEYDTGVCDDCAEGDL